MAEEKHIKPIELEELLKMDDYIQSMMSRDYSKPDSVKATYHSLEVSKGKKIKVLVVQPGDMVPGQRRPGVLWLHGGGHVVGRAEMVYITRAIDLVTRAGAVVVAPAYSLAINDPYPAALNECHKALMFMKENHRNLGIRSDQIIVGGESAGGGLAVALCMYTRDHGTVNIAFQIPIYPMLDCYDTPSSRDNYAPVWDTSRNHLAWKLYLRRIKDKENIPPYASPSRQEDYSNLPPCYSFVGEIEAFRDETIRYIDNLKAAGVEAELDIYPGFHHCYDMIQSFKADAKHAADVFVEKFKEACEKYTAPQKK